MKKIFFLLSLTLLASSANSAPSFDCKKAGTEVEKQICASEPLSILDVRLSSRYAQLKTYRGVTKSQRAWLTQRNASCEPVLSEERETCLITSYGFQLAELEILTKQDTSQKLIAICDDIATSYYDSGATIRMNEGSAFTITCLRGVLDSLGKNKIDDDRWSQLIRNAGNTINTLYWSINNYRKSCDGHCGTMYRLFSNLAVIDFYQDIIKEIYKLEQVR